jgi:hypothetical protein
MELLDIAPAGTCVVGRMPRPGLRRLWTCASAGPPIRRLHRGADLPADPDAVAVMPWVVARLAELLDRDLVTELAATGALTALLRVLERGT